MDALMASAGIVPTGDFLNCLCPNGFHYYSGPDAVQPCRHIGPLGGVDWAGVNGAAVEACAAAFRLPDGRTVVGALADRLLQVRKAQRGNP